MCLRAYAYCFGKHMALLQKHALKTPSYKVAFTHLGPYILVQDHCSHLIAMPTRNCKDLPKGPKVIEELDVQISDFNLLEAFFDSICEFLFPRDLKRFWKALVGEKDPFWKKVCVV